MIEIRDDPTEGSARHNKHNNGQSSSSQSKPSKLRGTNGLLIAFVVVLFFFVFSLGGSLVFFNRRLHNLATENARLRSDFDVAQATIETLASSQETNSQEWMAKCTATAAKDVKQAEVTFQSKIDGIKKLLNSVQSELSKLKETVEERSLDGRVSTIEAQVAIFRRMFGLAGNEEGGEPSPPVNHRQPEQQQQQQPNYPPQQYQVYAPGGVPVKQYQQQEPAGQQNFVMHAPIDRAEELPDSTKELPSEERNQARAQDIKNEFLASWNAYRKHAWGHDELCPNSKSHKDWGGSKSRGIALTAVDSLTTLYLMGLNAEFDEGVKLVTEYVDYDQDIKVSVFETTIRVVGGLLSAYELSGEVHQGLLETAVYVMDKLLCAFNTTTGIPHQTVNLKTHEHWNPDWSNGASILSEFGSLQLEMRTLSYHTKNPRYDIITTHLMSILEAKCSDMMCPTMFDVATAEARSEQITLGALGDSYFEYLVKQYMLTDKAEPKYRDMSRKALEAIRSRLLRYSSSSHQAYVGEYVDGALNHKMDHLACFSGGMFALAAQHVSADEDTAAYRKIAAEITETCFLMYDTQASGLAPEIVEFPQGQDFRPGESYYLLRPETVESIFYLWRTTKDEKYRRYQWKIFQHLKKYCKSDVTGGYSGVTMVSIVPPEQDDLMQSFWMAETMKYIYLTFVEDARLDLDKWVFNTEAHPFKIRRRDPLDIWKEWEAKHDGTLPWIPPTVEGVSDVETETMQRERHAHGARRHVAAIDPLGQDMRAQDEFDAEMDKVPEDPQENVFARKPTRHDVTWRKVSRALHYSRRVSNRREEAVPIEINNDRSSDSGGAGGNYANDPGPGEEQRIQ